MIERRIAKIIGLALGFTALSGLIAWELITGQPTSIGSSGPIALPGAKEPPGTVEPASQIDEMIRKILARPVFSPDRQPIASGAPKTNGLPRLSGIVVSTSEKIAIFAGPPGGHPSTGKESERIGAYKVKTITVTGVTVSGPDGTTLITPTFDSGAPPPGRPAVQARPEKPGTTPK